MSTISPGWKMSPRNETRPLLRCDGGSAPRKASKSEWLVQLTGGANCHLDSCTRGAHQSLSVINHREIS